jgi:hypothetical protein
MTGVMRGQAVIVTLPAGGILRPTAAASPPTGHGAQLSAKIGAALDDLLTGESRQETAINTHAAGNTWRCSLVPR